MGYAIWWLRDHCDFDPARKSIIEGVANDVRGQAVVVSEITKRLSGGLVKLASKADLELIVSPEIAKNYRINIGAIKEADKFSAVQIDDGKDFADETVSFPSANSSDPNYICSVVFQKPHEDVYCVSAYMMETYLGQYAYKANWYFRKTSRNAAMRCYKRVLGMVRDLRSDFVENQKNHSEIPYNLKRALQGEAGEIEHVKNKMAVYLDPKNVHPSKTIGSENFITIPKKSLLDELVM